jgi:hypothetical protein
MIPQQIGLILGFLELESLRAWHYQLGSTPLAAKRHWIKSKFDGGKSGCKKKKFNPANFILML